MPLHFKDAALTRFLVPFCGKDAVLTEVKISLGGFFPFRGKDAPLAEVEIPLCGKDVA